MKSSKISTIDILTRFENAHGSRFDYTKVQYINSGTKVIIGCRLHGDFTQLPADHSHGRGCVKCNGGVKKDISQFKSELNIVFGDLYDLSAIVYVNADTKVIIGCNDHGFFSQTPSMLLSGFGCNHLECRYNRYLDANMNSNRMAKNDITNYRKSVRTISDRNYRRHWMTIDPTTLRGKEFHLDHIISIVDGFNNDLDPEVIGHPTNLRIVTRLENLQKQGKSNRTIQEALDLIDIFNGFQLAPAP
jgi:hypothetical protein